MYYLVLAGSKNFFHDKVTTLKQVIGHFSFFALPFFYFLIYQIFSFFIFLIFHCVPIFEKKKKHANVFHSFLLICFFACLTPTIIHFLVCFHVFPLLILLWSVSAFFFYRLDQQQLFLTTDRFAPGSAARPQGLLIQTVESRDRFTQIFLHSLVNDWTPTLTSAPRLLAHEHSAAENEYIPASRTSQTKVRTMSGT